MDLWYKLVSECLETSSADLTLFSLVNPLAGHSPTPSGESIDVILALSIQGSLMMFTVKPLVALMLLVVSLSRGLLLQDMDIVGGLAAT